MPRIPRNPGSGKPPHNGPAKGAGLYGPAVHVSMGPAKGGGDKPAKPFTPEISAMGRAAAHDPVARQTRAEIEQQKSEDAALARKKLRELLMMPVTPATGMILNTAITTMLNRTEGAVIGRNINVNTDDLSKLDDDALDAQIEGMERDLRQAH